MLIAEQHLLLMRRISQGCHSVSSEVAASAWQVVAMARELLGGNGVVADFLVRAAAFPSCSKPEGFRRCKVWDSYDVQPVALAGGQAVLRHGGHLHI